MTELKEFRLPDVGEGLTEADIVAWHVKPGDQVEVNQVIVEIETAKAVVELPSPWDGTVARLLAEEGQTVDVGMPIISVDVSGDQAAAAVPGEPAAAARGGEQTNSPERTVVLPPHREAPQRPGAGARSVVSASAAERPPTEPAQAETGRPETGQPETGQPETGQPETGQPETGQPETGRPEWQAVLVGYGVKASSTTRRPRKAAPSVAAAAARPEMAEVPTGPEVARQPLEVPKEPQASPPVTSTVGALAKTSTVRALAKTSTVRALAKTSTVRALAKPPVRKLAKDLGISLAELTGSGPDGSITRDDVQRAASCTTARSEKELAGDGPRPASLAAAPRGSGVPSPAVEERIAVRGVRKHMAAAMVSSAFTAPHVTEFLQVDVTETMAAVRRVRELPEFVDVRVSPLLFAARALLIAVGRHPLVNSSWDADAQEIVIKHHVNLGIAVAADRGLIVPNVKDAGGLPLPELARRLQALTETARAGKATPTDLAGGTITITNVGVFGVDGGTPILTPGEAAILAFGQVRDAPWVVDGQLAVRQACTLSLSFDHRIVDGELGSAVLRDVGSMLEDPVRMLAWT